MPAQHARFGFIDRLITTKHIDRKAGHMWFEKLIRPPGARYARTPTPTESREAACNAGGREPTALRDKLKQFLVRPSHLKNLMLMFSVPALTCRRRRTRTGRQPGFKAKVVGFRLVASLGSGDVP